MTVARIGIKTIRIMGPARLNETTTEFDARNQAAYDGIDWSQVEDTVNDTLPEGYYCKADD